MINFLIYLLTTTCIFGILALSLNLQYGLAGLANLGQAAFFMLGAYVSVLLVMFAGQPFLVGLLGGVLSAGVFGVLIALPTRNLQQDYWAVATLAGAEIVRLFFLNQSFGSPYVGASFGISGIPRPLREYFSTDAYGWFYLFISFAALVLTLLFLEWLFRTPFGRALKSLRDGDDSIPLALGKDVSGLRIRSMAIGGMIGGLAGGLFAFYNAFIDPNYFLPLETFLVWTMVILGGAGNNYGVIVGVFVVQLIFGLSRFVRDYVPLQAESLGSLRLILIGVLILLIIMYRPKGLFGERKRVIYDSTSARRR